MTTYKPGTRAIASGLGWRYIGRKRLANSVAADVLWRSDDAFPRVRTDAEMEADPTFRLTRDIAFQAALMHDDDMLALAHAAITQHLADIGRDEHVPDPGHDRTRHPRHCRPSPDPRT